MPQTPITRRELLKALAAATGAAVLSSVPVKWETPIVEVGELPAHAQSLSGFGAISGTVFVDEGAPAPERGLSPSKTHPAIPVALSGGFNTSATYNGTSGGFWVYPYILTPVPAGTHDVVAYYCNVSLTDSGEVVHAGQTTTGVNFTFNFCD